MVDVEVDGIDSDTMDDYWVQGLVHFESLVCGVPVDRGIPEGLGLFSRAELKAELVLGQFVDSCDAWFARDISCVDGLLALLFDSFWVE